MQRVLDPGQIEAFAQRSIPRIRLPDPAALFARRAARLRALSDGHALGDYLRLMAVLCGAQQSALDGCWAASTSEQERIKARLDLARTHGMPLLQAAGWPRDERWRAALETLCAATGAAAGFPPAVRATAERIRALPVAELEAHADRLLTPGSEAIDVQIAPWLMAALQVYFAHLLRALTLETVSQHVARMGVPGVCPVCGTLPLASVVRAETPYQGYRYLHCALCATEWHLVRVQCSQCRATQGIHLHSIEGGSNAVRAEACEGCRSYRKICYQEEDPAIEPLADDLASLALDLLMTEAGFHRASGHPLLWQA